jgi:hypothetical protein
MSAGPALLPAHDERSFGRLKFCYRQTTVRGSVLLAISVLIASAQQRTAGDLSYLDLLHEGYRLTSSDLAREEAELSRNPGDLSARARLISHYFQYAMPQPRFEHVLWVVQHHPESKLAGSPVAAIVPGPNPLNSRSDYERVRSLWLGHLESHPNDPAILSNAATFFEPEETTRAETLFKRAWDLDRDNKMRLAALASFYSRALSACQFHQPNAPRKPCPGPDWIGRVKSSLESATDASLIEAVAEPLLRLQRGLPGTWDDPTFPQRLLRRARELRGSSSEVQP